MWDALDAVAKELQKEKTGDPGRQTASLHYPINMIVMKWFSNAAPERLDTLITL